MSWPPLPVHSWWTRVWWWAEGNPINSQGSKVWSRMERFSLAGLGISVEQGRFHPSGIGSEKFGSNELLGRQTGGGSTQGGVDRQHRVSDLLAEPWSGSWDSHGWGCQSPALTLRMPFYSSLPGGRPGLPDLDVKLGGSVFSEFLWRPTPWLRFLFSIFLNESLKYILAYVRWVRKSVLWSKQAPRNHSFDFLTL